MSTKVEVTCISKKEVVNYDPDHPVLTQIQLEVPYDQSSIFFQMSGGTKFELCTINQEAADQFKIGKKYEVLINPIEENLQS